MSDSNGDAGSNGAEPTPDPKVPPTEPTTESTADVTPVEPTEPVVADTTPADTTPVEPTPAPAATPAAASTTVRQEKQFLDSFVAAVVPILKTPIVVTTALAVALALVFSLVASAVVGALINLIADTDNPDSFGDWWDFAWVNHFQFHQVPLDSGDSWTATAPFLLLPVALAACWAGIRVARLILANNTATSPRLTAIVFASTYMIANVILSAFGPTNSGVRVLLAILITFGVAWIAATWRWWPGSASGAAAVTVDAPTHAEAGFGHKVWRTIAIPLSTLAAMIVVASVLTLVANIVQTFQDDNDGKRGVITNHVTHAIDNGWATVGYGFLAKAGAESETSDSAFRNDDDDDEDGDDDETESTSVRAWDLNGNDLASSDSTSSVLTGNSGVGGYDVAGFIIVLVAAFGTALLGSLYGGFRLARAAGRALTPRDAVLAGALLGPIWAGLSIVLTLVVTDGFHLDTGFGEIGFTTLSGVEVFFLILLFGGVLGGVGGYLATQNTTAGVPTPEPDAGTPPPAV